MKNFLHRIALVGFRRMLVGLPLVGRPLRLSRSTHDGPAASAGPTIEPSRLSLSPSLLLSLFLLLTPHAHAQWQTTTYTLHGGWNSIYLHGDATHATIDQLLAANPEVISVWRWNPNANPIQFGSSPLIPVAGSIDWNIWVRGQPAQTTLASLLGQTAYLVECSGVVTDNFSLTIPQKVQPPRSTWVRNGANLLGFPTKLGGAYPTFAAYFATFPVAVAANTKIYKYVGGPLNAANPVQVFSPSFEPLDRTQAYWFDAAVVSDFYAPLEVSPSNLAGLSYGRTGSRIIVRVRNRTAAVVTLTVAPVASASAPVGQEAITAAVPLTRRTFDAGTASYVDTAVSGPFGVVLAPQSSVELSFGVDRSLITGATDALYASLLRFTESGNLMDVVLPVTARVTSLAGLWVGDVAATNVQSKAPGSPGTTTASPYPLRVIIHVDNTGTARLLSQVFLGRLAPAPYDLGVCTKESLLKADDKANARRLVAAHLPVDTEVSSGSGSVALGATLVRAVSVGFAERTNPYVHTYHPDHDNKNPRFEMLTTPLESPNIARSCAFTFTLTPPVGTSASGWGSTVIGGTYAETVTGLHKDALTVTGTFELRRISEIGSITTN